MISFLKKRTSNNLNNGGLDDIHSDVSIKDSDFNVSFENSDNDLNNE